MDQVYKMQLHQIIALEDGTTVLRVPGGWIYTQYQLNSVSGCDGQWSENYIPSSVFVPFDTDNQWQ